MEATTSASAKTRKIFHVHRHVSMHDDIDNIGNSNGTGDHLHRCESTGQLLSSELQLSQNRYFQHHHSPTHPKSIKRLESIGDQIQKLQRHRHRNHHRHIWHSRNSRSMVTTDDTSAGIRLVKSGIDLNRMGPNQCSTARCDTLTEEGEFEQAQVVREHEFLPATCSRYAAKCEACRQTVHGSRYFYCRNCPSVCHNSHYCWLDLQRICPAVDVGIIGWGEGWQTTSYGLQNELDLEFVFLSGPMTLGANKCAECGRMLEKSLGRSLDAPTDVGEQEQKHRHRSLRSLMHSSKEQNSGMPKEAKRVSVCHYTGQYYCERCHWGDEWYIPGSIFVLNDYAKHPDLSFQDKHWHETCFICSQCQKSLADKSFATKEEQIYCPECFEEKFAARCDGCGKTFKASMRKYEYKGGAWHEECFLCAECKQPIGTKSFIPKGDSIVCIACYEDKFAQKCANCQLVINKGGITYKGQPWHKECFLCAKCSCQLAGQKFTSKDDAIYCADCYSELFAKRCTHCSKPISGFGGCKFITFEDKNWHSECFNCHKCKSSLVGRGFLVEEDGVVCPDCGA